MPFLSVDPRDLSNSGLSEDSIFFNTTSATKFESNNTSYVTSQQLSAGSNLPTGNAKQYETAFTDATGNPNYTPGTPVFVQGAYTLTTKGQKVNEFKDCISHWAGSSGYTRYRYVADHIAGRSISTVVGIKKHGSKKINGYATVIDSSLPENTPEHIKLMNQGKGGALSYVKGNPSRLVFDFVFYLDGNKRCPLPSPISGEIKYVGNGSNSATEIRGPRGRVRMLHMDNFLVKKGDKVVEGQIIGRQSDIMPAGRNVHLHIEAPEDVLREYVPKMLDGSYVPGAKTAAASSSSTRQFGE